MCVCVCVCWGGGWQEHWPARNMLNNGFLCYSDHIWLHIFLYYLKLNTSVIFFFKKKKRPISVSLGSVHSCKRDQCKINFLWYVLTSAVLLLKLCHVYTEIWRRKNINLTMWLSTVSVGLI